MSMMSWLRSIPGLTGLAGSRPIPEALWLQTLQNHAFLQQLPEDQKTRLRGLASDFLAHKEFSGAHGLEISDEMAVAIAAQACLPVLHIGLKLYDDFKGIVVHPATMLARREVADAAGVVHRYSEALAGEAMQHGPVALSWQDVAASGESAQRGHNVVIHEFVHKIDMREGHPNGCPPLPSRAAKAAWQTVMQQAYAQFRHQIVMTERFGAEPPWLDSYGAQSPVEFFAVAAEAYFVNRPQFEADFPDVAVLFDGFFGFKQTPV